MKKREQAAQAALTRNEVHDHFKRVLAGTKWERMRGLHTLRHSFISACASKGVDQRLVQEWAGSGLSESHGQGRSPGAGLEGQGRRLSARAIEAADNMKRAIAMAVSDALQLPLDDIQGWVVRGYHWPFAVHLFLSFADTMTGRTWLRSVVEDTTTALPWPEGRKPESTLNLAFSFAGLNELGVRRGGPCRVSPGVSAAGVAASFDLLGGRPDGPNAWEIGGLPQQMHALVSLHCAMIDSLTQRLKTLRNGFGLGVQERFTEPTALCRKKLNTSASVTASASRPSKGLGYPFIPGMVPQYRAVAVLSQSRRIHPRLSR